MPSLAEHAKDYSHGYCSLRILVTWLVVSFALCLIYAIIAFLSLLDKNILPEEPGPLSLPYTNVPRRYDIHLKFDTEYNRSNKTFSGTVSVLFSSRHANQRLFLHKGENLRIMEFSLRAVDHPDEKRSVKKGTYNSATEIQTFVLSFDTSTDTAYLFTVTFNGVMTGEAGPNEFHYDSENNEKRYGVWFATFQRRGKGLRYLFPCMDSNEFAAEYNVTSTIQENYRNHCFSGVNLMTDHFPSTMVLLPYQFSLILCDFQYKRELNNETMISIYSQSSLLSNASFRRIVQFADLSSKTIGKNDVVVIPNAKTLYRPGISIINEKEFVSESKEFQMTTARPVQH
ncbi:hypothetical protein Q1695_001611 [Nippostrongylus brasiliensis]|nr:hypothetical protein Q1695_001611 [Nippostrongylus brasiliensis]